MRSVLVSIIKALGQLLLLFVAALVVGCIFSIIVAYIGLKLFYEEVSGLFTKRGRDA